MTTEKLVNNALFGKTELKTAEDVENYVEALKEELLRQINENRRITLY